MSGWRKRQIGDRVMGDYDKYKLNYNGITYTVTVNGTSTVILTEEPKEDLGEMKEAREYLECLMKKR